MINDPQRRLEIRTPEGVQFSLILAGPFARFLAWFVDCVVIFGATSLLSSILGPLGMIGYAVTGVAAFSLTFLYRIAMEWKFRGQTLGKRLLRLRVMDETGLRLQFNQVALRNLIRVVDMMPMAYVLGGVTSLINPRGQRLGDIAAGTIVVYTPRELRPDFDRVLSGKYNSFREHPHLEARLRQQVTPEEANLLVGALLRRDHLDSAERLPLFAELAEHFRGKVAFPEAAVAGITDEQYLRNVVDTVFRTQKRG